MCVYTGVLWITRKFDHKHIVHDICICICVYKLRDSHKNFPHSRFEFTNWFRFVYITFQSFICRCRWDNSQYSNEKNRKKRVQIFYIHTNKSKVIRKIKASTLSNIFDRELIFTTLVDNYGLVSLHVYTNIILFYDQHKNHSEIRHIFNIPLIVDHLVIVIFFIVVIVVCINGHLSAHWIFAVIIASNLWNLNSSANASKKNLIFNNPAHTHTHSCLFLTKWTNKRIKNSNSKQITHQNCNWNQRKKNGKKISA